MLIGGTDELPVNIDLDVLLSGSKNICELSIRVVIFSEKKLSVKMIGHYIDVLNNR